MATSTQTSFTMNGVISLGAATQVASVVGAMTVDMSTSHYEVTGGNAITGITGTGSTEGDLLFLRFASTASITDGGTLVMNGDFAGAADEYIVFVNNGGGTGAWTEIARSIPDGP